jgi:hypothetical protein
MPELEFKLRQDGVTKGFSSNTRAVRDKKYGWVWHGCWFPKKQGWLTTMPRLSEFRHADKPHTHKSTK